ncbi:uncharacterized protein [Henckelia pumila]|uniref:uncharacterized protein n=1 Tax=Henckelia pumila TaxID=405737 RepID=UPI003C6DD2BE
MADPSSNRSGTIITDLGVDALAYCASFMRLRDVSNMAMSCRYLNTAAYSDSVWQSLFRDEWPYIISPRSLLSSSVREAYSSRHTSLRQFKFLDPLVTDVPVNGKLPQHMLFDKDDIIFSQGPQIRIFDATKNLVTRGNHKARITCMRLFPVNETSLYQNESESGDNILITSSSDHYIRLWWKGWCRCFKGHTGPASTLSDKFLGNDTGRIFASGGEDCTVRLWSIDSTRKRGQHALVATLYGHEKAVSLMSVAGYKTSLLVSLSKNGKVRVWDTTAASSSLRTTCCVGMTSVTDAPVGLKCHGSLLYIACSSSVIAIDLRTMRRVFTIVQQAKIHSFEAMPSKSILCTGGTGRGFLWDTRRVSDTHKFEPVVELDGHVGPVKHLHTDACKVVTGGPDDPNVNVWDIGTGTQTNSLSCSSLEDPSRRFGCVAMAVDGCRIVTASGDDELCILRYRDFSSATHHVSSNVWEESSMGSKFWNPQSGDPEDLDW